MPPAPIPRAAQEVFSVVVNDVSVKTLLFALARDNKLNVDIHPSVGGRVTLNASDQTLPQLLERIASQTDIRYEVNGNLLRVQPDAPYFNNYTVDYVNLTRNSSSLVSVASTLGGNSSSTASASSSGGGSTTINSSADNRFWDTLVSNLCQIVLTSNQNRNQRDELIERQRLQERDDRLKVALEIAKAVQPNQATGQPNQGGGSSLGSGGGISNGTADLMRQVLGSTTNTPNATQGGGSGSEAAGVNPNTSTNNSRTAVANTAGTCGQNVSNSGQAGGAGASQANNPIMVNKESGVLSINTTSKGHDQVKSFLDRVMSGARRQVLIEATVVEVQLSANAQSGVNWQQLINSGAAKGLNIGIGPTATNSVSSAVTTANSAATLSYTNLGSRIGDITAAISLLEGFGQTKVLSSPKLSVINNQTAIIKVVDDYVYVTIEFTPGQRSANASGGVTQLTPDAYTSKVNTIPVGFVMTVTPQISDSGDVTLNVRPSITRVIREITDPNPALLNIPRPIVNKIPIIQSRELESVLRVQSGEIAVLGGLMQESQSGAQEGLPGINRTAAGAVLGQRSEARAKTELLVFMRPVVIRDASINGDYKEFKSQLPTSTFFNGTASEAWGNKK
jgi:general secretion pathway protein D